MTTITIEALETIDAPALPEAPVMPLLSQIFAQQPRETWVAGSWRAPATGRMCRLTYAYNMLRRGDDGC